MRFDREDGNDRSSMIKNIKPHSSISRHKPPLLYKSNNCMTASRSPFHELFVMRSSAKRFRGEARASASRRTRASTQGIPDGAALGLNGTAPIT